VRVGLVCPYDLGAFGGVQDLVTGLAGWLGEAGHEAWVVGPGAGGSHGLGMVGVGRTVVVPVNGSAAKIALGRGVSGRVRQALASADIVHIHEPFVPVVSLAATTASGSALVGTFHADPSPGMRRIYSVAAPVLRRVTRRLDVVTAVSPVAAAAAAPFGPVRLIPNAIDTSEFDPEPGLAHRVAFLGRDDPRKGLDVLLAAWPQVRLAVPDAELVVAAGDRRGELPGVRFVGSVGPADRRRLLAEAAVFCAPNLGGESFGIVLVQAMASRCAVVASALPAFAHVLGAAGALVKPGDVAGLAATLAAVLGDDGRRRALQDAAVASVARFDRTTVTTRYLAAYDEAISRSAARRSAG